MCRLYRYFRTFWLLVLSALLLTSCSEPEAIVNNLQEKDANEIIVYLAGKGIHASKVEAASGAGGGNAAVTWNIVVDSNESVQAMAILNRVGLPRPPVKSLLEVFQASGLVPSAQEQKIRYQAAIEEKIAGTIRKIDGVLSVDVQLSLQVDEDKGEKPSGSVFIKHQGVVDDPNNQLITKVKRLVAGSVDGLEYDRVTVISDVARFAAVDLDTKEDVVHEEERNDYVGIWGIIVLKESVQTFRIVFFSAVIVVLFFFGVLLWMFWRTAPLMKRAGGVRKLFSFGKWQLANEEEEQDTAEEQEGEESEEEGEEAPQSESEESEEESSEEDKPQ